MSRMRRLTAELCLIGLLLLTGGVIALQHEIFGRDIEVAPGRTNAFSFSGYADEVGGGASTMTSPGPLSWNCDVRESALSARYCGYEVVLDGNGSLPGVDLRNLEKIALTLDYHGPAKTLRFQLKNEDPRYSTHGDRSTAKVNKVEFTVREGRQTIVFEPQDFSVAEWWLMGKNIPVELGRLQLDNVVAVEVATGTSPPSGHYSFRIESMTLQRSSVGPARLYLMIMGVWAVVIALYMLLRMRRTRQDALEKDLAQAEARVALAKAKQAAERASEAKSAFLASMSHELRTPLNAVLGYAQLLERARLAPEHLASVRTIHRSGVHLLSLITDLLDLSKIEAGKMELHPAPVSVRGAIAAVAEMIEVRAEEKGLAFNCEVEDAVPEAVSADDKRLRQILLNLLSNAVKFTNEGRVSLRVGLVERTRETARLRFEVQDSGTGISENELEQIFRPFEQVGGLEGREAGAGLGLAISRQLAGLMGATIQVQSRVGHGSSFWFEASFPLADAAPVEEHVASSKIVGYAGERRRVLVVDDNQDNRGLLCDLLEQLGFATEVACEGREAVRLAQLTSPDIILMDLKMPGMDGLEATRLIRVIEPLKAVPIVAVSANNAEEGEASARAAGADAYVSKPINNCELLRTVGELLAVEWLWEDAKGGKTAAGAASAETPTAAAQPGRVLRILAAEDNAINQRVLRAMLDALDVELEIAADGAQAVRAVETAAFDLVLMDMQMPEMNGTEATRAIRQWEAKTGQARTPIIALSADAGAEHVAGYLAAGMDGHLAKPIEISELYGLLAQFTPGAPVELKLAG
ncbi:response regulator [Phenylobacterium deserti]|uniref:histidine kinase n=1 Tax=Phenylobacterium deserti TaxID=1914756 RepID=A0A328AA64_9CAUL|nr:response regulator [Phenylobacterium deserti]RAK51439.1 hypothetical protein DJ018_16005 [Phenylobacterium deserti]